ncbi:MAG: DNA polymerase I [Gammaproteobacteria bacterium]|nr:MAG: DNA polymerase I [Gammaproteobacteria bacterium]
MNTSCQRPFIIIDGSSYLFRAYHGLPALSNQSGEPTGAIFGVVNMLKKVLQDYQPDRIVVVFDAKGKTFRHQLYPEYKSHRPPMPEDLRVQIEPLHDIIRAMGLPMLVIDDVEADDVLATLAMQAQSEGWTTLMATGDKDMAQIVTPKILMLDTMKGITLDPEGVKQKFGVYPEKIIDYLALTGDTSDNIPGVPGVGPKTAVKWLDLYGSVDGIIEHADEIKGKVGERLRNSLDQLRLSRQLVTVRHDVSLPVSLDDLRQGEQDRASLLSYSQRFGFRRWEEELRYSQSDSSTWEEHAIDRAHYEIILTQAQLQQWTEWIRGNELFCFDLETTSLDMLEAEIVGIALAVEDHAGYIPLQHADDSLPQLSSGEVLEALKPFLVDTSYAKVGHNLKYDMGVLQNVGIQVEGPLYDTMLESYVLNSSAGRHDMDSVAFRELGHKTISYEEVAGKGAKQIRFDQVPIRQAAEYAAEDADVTLRLHQHLWSRLEQTPQLVRLLKEIEFPLIPVLMRMERNGVGLDCDLLNEQSRRLQLRLQQIQSEAHELAGEPFNLDSPKQIQAILYDKLSLPVRKKTPKGQPSTAESVLQELAYDYPLPRLILEYRSLNKLRNTYTETLPQRVNPKTGRIHTSYHQAVAATGRLSSTDPNLQNIPVRTEEGRAIRQAFVAPSGFTLIAADYSQIELRILAHLSGDHALIEAFRQNQDIHTATAASVFGCEPDDVTPEQRRRAKAINFGIIYGMSAFGLARQLEVERDQAQFFIDEYFLRFPNVKVYLNGIRKLAREQGYVETLFGRRLYLPEIRSSNHQRRMYAERAAINAPMQGTAADIIKRAMLAVDRWIQSQAGDVRMIMQVHDELVLEAPENQAEEIAGKVVQLMESAADLNPRLVVDVGIGRDWGTAH